MSNQGEVPENSGGILLDFKPLCFQRACGVSQGGDGDFVFLFLMVFSTQKGLVQAESGVVQYGFLFGGGVGVRMLRGKGCYSIS